MDSGSVDGTEQIARQHKKFLTRAWTNYADQKNFAAQNASNDWILSIDADEEHSSPLRSSQWNWKKHDCEADRLRNVSPHLLSRRMDRSIPAGIPIFSAASTAATRGYSGIIHESLRFNGQPGRLAGDLLHYTVRSFDEHQANVEKYTTFSAQRMFAKGKRRWRGALSFATPWSCFQNHSCAAAFLTATVVHSSRKWRRAPCASNTPNLAAYRRRLALDHMGAPRSS